MLRDYHVNPVINTLQSCSSYNSTESAEIFVETDYNYVLSFSVVAIFDCTSGRYLG